MPTESDSFEEFLEPAAPSEPAAERRPIEQWAAAKAPPAWLAAAAKGLRDWPLGAEVTEAEYDVALAEASAVTLGG